MRILVWLVLFILLLAFAAKNTEPVALRFYFDLAWQMPLVALLAAFFAANASSRMKSASRTSMRMGIAGSFPGRD